MNTIFKIETLVLNTNKKKYTAALKIVTKSFTSICTNGPKYNNYIRNTNSPRSQIIRMEKYACTAYRPCFSSFSKANGGRSGARRTFCKPCIVFFHKNH